MNTSIETMEHHPTRETALKWVAGGSMVEAVGALATIALAIVGLAGVLSQSLAAIATIVIGASILIEGGAFTAGSISSAGTGSVRGEKSAAFLGGVAGVVLGILALLGVSSLTLLSVAILVYGGTFLLSGFSAQMGPVGGTSIEASSGGHFMVGVAGVVLGILAIVGLSPLTLVLVGLLSLGAAALFTGSMTSTGSVTALTK